MSAASTDGRANGARAGSPARSPKVAEQLAHRIANNIIERKLPEGATLPVEREMLEEFRVGRTTLREALRLLETRGLLTIRAGPRGGPVVHRPAASDLGGALTLILGFERARLSDVYEARNALEPMVSELAAPRITPSELAELDDSIARTLANLDDHALFVDENRRFHSVIANAAGSPGLRVFLETLQSVADGATRGVEYGRRRRELVAQAHRTIVERLAAGDAPGAREAMRRHIADAARYWDVKYPHLYAQPVRWLG
jgi:GntR family transcriptional regulator, transcriptional repressor for pyruvate dehydrogenase complex